LAEVRVKEPEQEEGAIPVRRAYLQSLVVTEHARGAGVGSALLRAAEEWATARGAEEMELDHWVFPGDPGGFYDGAGYRLLSAMRVKPLSPDG
jgi:GNAT superfamily N-acetyltransferase